MTKTRSLKQKLAQVDRLWSDTKFGQALSEVEKLMKAWPGSAHLLILWASLVQLQDKTDHTLDDAKKALQSAIEMDRTSPAGFIELGQFFDSVEDNPQEASKAFSEGVALARQLLIEGLLGQAKSLMQLSKREEAIKCIIESLQLTNRSRPQKGAKAQGSVSLVDLKKPVGPILGVQLGGSFGSEIESILNDALTGLALK